MSLHRQNKERLISEISNFEVGEQKIRICPNDPINYELIIWFYSEKTNLIDNFNIK